MTREGEEAGLPTTQLLIDAVERAVATLREELARAEARADAAEALVIEVRTEIEGLKQAHRTAREAAQALLRPEGHGALAAQQTAAELRLAEQARKARGLLAGLRRAWRGSKLIPCRGE